MRKRDYNWWDNPKNADEVKRISWWDKEENQTTITIPISMVENKSGGWSACTNDKTKALLGGLHGVASGKTKEEAMQKLLVMLKFSHHFAEDRWRRYERWVPFRKGPWKSIGGRWIAIFGFHVSFRVGKKMKHGWYIPLTNLNISMHNDWTNYRRWKRENP